MKQDKDFIQEELEKAVVKMASKLINIHPGLQCLSPVLLPCPFLHRSDSGKLESTPTLPFSWHEAVSELVLTCTASS